MSDMRRLPTADGIAAATDRIRPILAETPVVRSEVLSDLLGVELYLKVETMSPIGSFKLRGALNRVMTAGDVPVVVTSSTGNHGQAVAWAARNQGLRCVIYLPENPHPEKRHKIALLDAEIVEVGYDLDVAKLAAKEFASDQGGMFVDDGEDIDVMEGAGTIGFEIGEQVESIDAVLVPVGGGNLISGTAAGVKSHQPSARVIGVAPAAGPAMHDSFHTRGPVEREVGTIAECLATRVPSGLALDAMLALVDDVVAVSDDDFDAAAHALALYAHVLAEPGSVGGLAGLVVHRDRIGDVRRVVVPVTGANVDAATLHRIVAATPIVSR